MDFFCGFLDVNPETRFTVTQDNIKLWMESKDPIEEKIKTELPSREDDSFVEKGPIAFSKASSFSSWSSLPNQSDKDQQLNTNASEQIKLDQISLTFHFYKEFCKDAPRAIIPELDLDEELNSPESKEASKSGRNTTVLVNI